MNYPPMNVLNNLVKQLIPFASLHHLDLLQLLQLIDIVLSKSEVNLDDPNDVNHYLDTVLHLNSLLYLFNIPQSWGSDSQLIFDPDRINQCRSKVASVPRFQQLRLDKYKQFSPDILSLSESFIVSP